MSNHLGATMQLTLFTDYALRSLIFLATHSDRSSSVKEIAEHYGISRNHLVKVVHKMATLGLVVSSKGKGGGIRLAGDATATRLGDVVRKMEDMEIVVCFNQDTNTCRISGACRLKHILYEAINSFIQTLNKYTLADAAINKDIFASMMGKSRHTSSRDF